MYDPLAEDDVMISGEMKTQLPVAPPDSYLITAQLEATTLTCAEYRSLASLMSSLLCLPTGALVYVGHTLSPLTLHWHCSTAQKRESNPVYSIGLLTEMAQTGIRKIHIHVGDGLEVVIPQRNVSISATDTSITLSHYGFHVYTYTFMNWSVLLVCRKWSCWRVHMMGILRVWGVYWVQVYQWMSHVL